jgi:hypothetical protein
VRFRSQHLFFAYVGPLLDITPLADRKWAGSSVGGIMSRRVSALSVLAFALLATSSLLAQKTLTATEAKAHIGEQATVCGKVVSTAWATSSRGSPTFLNFDQPYPDQVFTLVIWGNNRSKFGDPEISYRGKRICVTGKISVFKGVPELVATDPSQIKAQ